MKPGCALFAAALAGLAAFVIVSSAGAGEDLVKAQGVAQVMNLADRSSPPPFAPGRIDVEFPEGGIEGLAVPEGLTDARVGKFEMGGKTLNLVLAKSTAGAKGHDVVYIDSDFDNALSDAEKITLTVGERPMRGGGTMVNGFKPAVSLAFADHDWTVVFVCTAMAGNPLRAQVLPTWFLEARFTVNEIEYVASFKDVDFDGSYDGEKDMWLLEQAGPRSRPDSGHGMAGLGNGCFKDGYVFTVRSFADGNVEFAYVAAEGPDPKDLAAQRERAEHVWFERFEKEREGFVSARGMDTSRPRAETPIQWRYVTREKAMAMSAAEGKPLFIDVMAFWCVWCYRMDFYTYVDAEVADFMNEKLIPVKIVQEQDSAGDYATLMKDLGARGIPAMGVWSVGGKDLLKSIGGWSKPEEFLAQLQEALEAAK